MAKNAKGSNSVRRRGFLSIVSTTTAVGLAGCTGGQEGGTATQSSTSESGGTTQGSVDSNGGWPDLSGKQFHFISGEPSGAAQDYWGMVTQDFKKATGADVKVEFTKPGESLNQRIIQLIQAGSTPNIAPGNMQSGLRWRNAGILRPVTGLVQEGIEKYGEPEKTLRLVLDGEDWLLPSWASYHIHWYRSDVTDIVPDTWSKITQYAKETDKSNGNTRGIYIPAGIGSHSSSSLLNHIWQNNGKTFRRNSNGKLQVAMADSPHRGRWIETLNWQKKLYDNWAPVAADATWTTSINAIPSGAAYSGWYSGVRPKSAAIDQGAEFAGELHPVIPKKKKRAAWAGAGGYVAFKQANNEVTDTFLRFWMQRKYLNPLYWKFSKVHNVPAWPGILEGDYYQTRLSELPPEWKQSDLNYYLKTAPKHGVTWEFQTDPKNPYTGNVFASQVISNLKQDVLVRDKEPGAAIDEYSKELQKVIDDAQEE